MHGARTANARRCHAHQVLDAALSTELDAGERLLSHVVLCGGTASLPVRWLLSPVQYMHMHMQMHMRMHMQCTHTPYTPYIPNTPYTPYTFHRVHLIYHMLPTWSRASPRG